MDVKGKVLLQFFNKSKLRNGTKTYLKQVFSLLFIVKFKKLGFSAPLRSFRSKKELKTFFVFKTAIFLILKTALTKTTTSKKWS